MKINQMFIGAALALLGICFGFAVASNVDASAEAKWWDLMTAFGTVGAVIAALGIALGEGYAARRMRYDQAVLLIVEAYPSFLALATTCETLRLHFGESEVVDRPPEQSFALIEVLRRQLIEAALPRAVSLQPLGQVHAMRLAAVNSHLEAVVRMVRPEVWQTQEGRKDLAKFILTGLEEAAPHLKKLGEIGLSLLSRMRP